MEWATADKQKILFHLVVASFVGDTPECEDLLSVEGGNKQTIVLICDPLRKKAFKSILNAEGEDFQKIGIEILNGNGRSVGTAMEKLTDQSLLPHTPILYTFSFVGITRCVDFYFLFRVEEMHLFSLGISRMLKGCR